MNEKDLDVAVLNYLKKRGFTSAQEKFLEESKVKPQSTPLPPQKNDLDSVSFLNYVLFHNIDESAATYEKNYSIFKEWVNSSLNMYRKELFSILYPVFVHCYLDLVQKNHQKEAADFLEAHRKEHELKHADEIRSISTIVSPEHMKDNEIVRTIRANKYVAQLSSYSFELLISYLMEYKFLLILSIINQYISIQVNALVPDESTEQDFKAITGVAEHEINKKPVSWGLLKEEMTFDDFDDRMDLEKMSKKDDTETINSKIPLPKLNETTRLQIKEDLEKRVNLNSKNLPSICFYTFLNANNSLNTVELSADGSLVATGFSDSSIKLWDVQKSHTRLFGTVGVDPHNGIEKKAEDDPLLLLGHSGPVYSLSFSPDNQFLLSSSEDTTVRLWSMETKTNLVCYKGHNYPVWGVDFSPLGYYFATCSHDKTARLWTTNNIFPLRIFAGHLSDVDCVKFHPNCNYIATGSSDKSVRLWEIHSGECVRVFTGHHGAIYSLDFSPNGRYLASAGEDGNIIIWDLAAGKKLSTFFGHQKTIWSISYSKDGSMIASGSADLTVKLWNTDKTDMESTNILSTNKNKPKTPPKNSPEMLGSYPTKKTPVYNVKFSRRNLLFASGVFNSSS